MNNMVKGNTIKNIEMSFSTTLRYDYQNVDLDAVCDMMEDLEIMIADKTFVKQRFAVKDKIFQVEKADNFEYTDPVDSSISRNQVHSTHSAAYVWRQDYVLRYIRSLVVIWGAVFWFGGLRQSLSGSFCYRDCGLSSLMALGSSTDSVGQVMMGPRFGFILTAMRRICFLRTLR